MLPVSCSRITLLNFRCFGWLLSKGFCTPVRDEWTMLLNLGQGWGKTVVVPCLGETESVDSVAECTCSHILRCIFCLITGAVSNTLRQCQFTCDMLVLSCLGFPRFYRIFDGFVRCLLCRCQVEGGQISWVTVRMVAIGNVTIITACVVVLTCWTHLLSCWFLVVAGCERLLSESWHCPLLRLFPRYRRQKLWSWRRLEDPSGIISFRIPEKSTVLVGCGSQCWRHTCVVADSSLHWSPCWRLSGTTFFRTQPFRDWKWAARLRCWVLMLLMSSEVLGVLHYDPSEPLRHFTSMHLYICLYLLLPALFMHPLMSVPVHYLVLSGPHVMSIMRGVIESRVVCYSFLLRARGDVMSL